MRNTYQSQQLRKMRLRACIRLWNLPLSYLGYEWGWKRVSDMRLDLAILLSEKFQITLQQLMDLQKKSQEPD
jgi:hypothetical protein